MKRDKECEEHDCEGLKWCTWHPEDCMGKPWAKDINKEEFPSLKKILISMLKENHEMEEDIKELKDSREKQKFLKRVLDLRARIEKMLKGVKNNK